MPFLTPYAKREIALSRAATGLLAVISALLWPDALPWPPLGILIVLLLPVLMFFRHPHRRIPDDPAVLLAPADGKITDIVELPENEFIHGPALRIGIFLSIFNVHINRAPCPGRLVYLKYRPGKFFNALRTEKASAHNESNCLGLHCPDHPAGSVMVKQISGVIARRIVCHCRIDEQLSAGQPFGMIKFGSRTELFLPKNDTAELLVALGDPVRAGTTIMVRYPQTP